CNGPNDQENSMGSKPPMTCTFWLRAEYEHRKGEQYQSVDVQRNLKGDWMSHTLGDTGSAGVASGNSTMMVAPRPSALLTAWIVARCASTIPRQIDKPRPDPCGLVVTKGSKIFSKRCGGMPLPVSETVMRRTRRLSTTQLPTRIASRPPDLIASRAFIQRLRKSCLSCALSASTSGRLSS